MVTNPCDDHTRSYITTAFESKYSHCAPTTFPERHFSIYHKRFFFCFSFFSFFSSFFFFFLPDKRTSKAATVRLPWHYPIAKKKKCFFKSVLVFTSLQIWILLPYLPHIFLISFQFWRMYVPPCCKHKCLSATSDFAQRAICL